eukprot:TRINITY_DN20251_c0_g1_i2.p1 TRINITY_DN20251_c0_g1~~TRINITY_DN20251_c0_g1_i2.p1  ORF type:complete len:413 (+),score=133.13 TRINITY_DN20251_c0_g1_i2:67-1305(+)
MPTELPPLLMMSEDESSFRYQTLVERCPRIVEGVIRDCGDQLSEGKIDSLRKLAAGMRDAGKGVMPKLRHVHGDGESAPESFSSVAPFVGGPWRASPWLHGECYLYHVMYEVCDIFGSNQGFDFFALEKQKSAEGAKSTMVAAAERMAGWPARADLLRGQVVDLLKGSLWGNRVDLALFGSGDQSRFVASDDSNIVHDDSEVVADLLCGLRAKEGCAREVHLVADNYGLEIFSDLVLLTFLVSRGLADRAVIHLKVWPYFVSDARVEDVQGMLGWLRGAGQPVALREFGAQCAGLVAEGKLVLSNHQFWNSPNDYRALPADIVRTLRSACVVLVKGDLNYRKLVGDRHWPHDTPFATAVDYFPAPVAALRTLKSEVVVGVAAARERAVIDSQGWPKWAVCGDFAVLQFAPGQ